MAKRATVNANVATRLDEEGIGGRLASWANDLELATALLCEATCSTSTLWSVTSDAVKFGSDHKLTLGELIEKESGDSIPLQRLAIDEMMRRAKHIIREVRTELAEARAETPGSLVAA